VRTPTTIKRARGGHRGFPGADQPTPRLAKMLAANSASLIIQAAVSTCANKTAGFTAFACAQSYGGPVVSIGRFACDCRPFWGGGGGFWRGEKNAPSGEPMPRFAADGPPALFQRSAPAKRLSRGQALQFDPGPALRPLSVGSSLAMESLGMSIRVGPFGYRLCRFVDCSPHAVSGSRTGWSATCDIVPSTRGSPHCGA